MQEVQEGVVWIDEGVEWVVEFAWRCLCPDLQVAACAAHVSHLSHGEIVLVTSDDDILS